MNQVIIQFDHWPDRILFPNARPHHMAKAASVRIAKEEAFWEARSAGSPHQFQRATILILITAKDNRKRDLDGFLSACKSWIDGIVEAGVLQDDNYFCVNQMMIRFEGVGTESTTIQITEVE